MAASHSANTDYTRLPRLTDGEKMTDRTKETLLSSGTNNAETNHKARSFLAHAPHFIQ